MRYLIIFLLMLGHGVGIAQEGCNIFPKTQKAYRAKSPFLSNGFIEVNSDALAGFKTNIAVPKNPYLILIHLGIAQKIKKRIVLHYFFGSELSVENGLQSKHNYGIGKIGIDYFFNTSMKGFGIGLYGHGINRIEGDISIPMLHLMYAKSNNRFFYQYQLYVYPNAERVVFGFGIGIGSKVY